MYDLIVESLHSLAEPIDAVHPYPGNARRGDVETITKSIRKHKQYRPIVANRRTGDILGGNHVWQSMVILGAAHIAVSWVDVDEDTAREMVLIDNRAAELGTFDDAALADLLALVPADALPDTGYTMADLDALLAAAEPEPVTKGNDDTGEKATATPVISYNLVFDDADQQAQWFLFIRWLKSTYSGVTLADRLDQHLRSGAPYEGGS